MELDPLKIILNSKNWNDFENSLSKLNFSSDSNKIKGDAFEYLTKYLLKSDPLYSSGLKQVYHHSELPLNIREELKLPHPEIGVDLIAEFDDNSYWAIQCKFHQNPYENVSYDEVKTFFSITERHETNSKLKHRLICTSANKVTDRVRKIHPHKLGFLTRHDYTSIDKENFEQIHSLILGNKPVLKPLKPRQHQIKAISETNNYFETKDRGKIIHPCGSGKSLTAYWIAKDISAKNILIAVPSLALVRQTLNAWSKQATADQTPIEYIAVCSDQDVAQADDPIVSSHDLGISVTTDSTKVSDFLSSNNNKLKVIITTYQSGNVIIESTNQLNYEFDLGIFDEAHKTTGDKNKKFAQLLNDNLLDIKKKIFMTATERQFVGNSDNIISMDNEEIYGKIINQLSFKKALTQDPPILCDYKVITNFVTKKEIEQLIVTNSLTRANGKNYTFVEDSTTIAALIAHIKLTKERNIKNTISFHKNIKRAKDFAELYEQLNAVDSYSRNISAYHVNGKMGTSDRNTLIENFKNSSPSLISNARCLTEGVDIPVVDAVIFADPKQSVIDIVQASGRAMRTHPNKKLGYIIIPVIVDNESPDITNDSFKQLVNIVAALGISDERIIDEAKLAVKTGTFNTREILEFNDFIPEFEVDFDKFVKEIKIKIWDRVSFAQSVVGETEFNRWMKSETKLSKASRYKYKNAVRKISNDLIKLNLAYSSLEEITDGADLEELKESYFSIKEFSELDKRGNSMYSSGFNRLIEFQNFKKKGNPF